MQSLEDVLVMALKGAITRLHEIARDCTRLHESARECTRVHEIARD